MFGFISIEEYALFLSSSTEFDHTSKTIRVGRSRKRSLLALLALPAPQNCDMLVSHRNIPYSVVTEYYDMLVSHRNLPFQFVIEDCDLLDRVQSL